LLLHHRQHNPILTFLFEILSCGPPFPRVFRLTRDGSTPTPPPLIIDRSRHRHHHFDTTGSKAGNLDDAIVHCPCHTIVNPYSLFLRYLPTETSHLSIAGPHYLCTLVIIYRIAYHCVHPSKVSKFCSRICTIATLVRANRILTKENIKRKKASYQREKSTSL
jgi:hypothetical protein